MKWLLILLASCMAVSSTNGFAVVRTGVLPLGGSATGGSAFVVSQRPSQHRTSKPGSSTASLKSMLYMGSMAKFGVFSPAVYVAKIVLGQDKLNKIRGKAISLHSQSISDFTEWVGAYHLRTRLIKKAKQNGDTLGFLV